MGSKVQLVQLEVIGEGLEKEPQSISALKMGKHLHKSQHNIPHKPVILLKLRWELDHKHHKQAT